MKNVFLSVGIVFVSFICTLTIGSAEMTRVGSDKVGIGTSSPQQMLHIYGNNPRILVEDKFTGNPEINFKTQNGAYGNDWAIYKHYNTGDLRFYNAGDKVTFEYGTGWVGIGLDNPKAPLTVNGTILLKDAPTYNFLPGYSGIFSNNSELFAVDGNHNTTQISPHDPQTGEWIFYSKNVKTGRIFRVNMEKLVREVERLSGKKFVEEWVEK